jgi:hypothetical protein
VPHLEETARKLAKDCEVPEEVRLRVTTRLEKLTELALRREVLRLAGGAFNYEHATIEQLYTWAVCGRLLAIDVSMFPVAREATRGRFTVLVEYHGRGLVEEESAEYSVFIDGQLFYRVFIARYKETAGYQYPAGWKEELATVHRSILACALRLLPESQGAPETSRPAPHSGHHDPSHP